MTGCYPEVTGAVESAVLWAVRQAEETLLSVGGKRQNIKRVSVGV